MNAARRIARALVPAPWRARLRQAHRDWIFSRAMKRFLADPRACAVPDNPTLNKLIYGWGNESWSALDEYLASCIQHAWDADGPILECGSGLSTLLVGAVAKLRGQRYWAFEHTPRWAEKVQARLARYGVDTVVLDARPLRDYGEFCWYDANSCDTLPDRFALVICDGPPGTTKGGRYGLLPVLESRLQPGAVILLDDAGRKQESEIARRWQMEFGAESEHLGTRKPYIKLTIGTSNPTQRKQPFAAA